MASSGCRREPILLKDMRDAKIYHGKKLCATMSLDYFDMPVLFLDDDGVVSPAATFPLSDDKGNVLLVKVLHVARAGVTGIVPAWKLREMYPMGAQIVVKDPIVLSKGQLLIHHPAKLEVVKYFPQETIDRVQLLTAAEVRDLGNVEYRKGRFLAALKYYELGLSKVAMADGSIVDEAEAALGFSNKAACFLQSGDFERGYLSCCSATKLQPDNPKLLARLGQAYLGLQEYDLAAEVLARAAELGPERYAAEELKQARTLAAQASSGEYGEVLKSWFLQKCTGSAPDVADYVGPVEIRMPAGTGGGLFATADVPAGALLLVSNAVSFEREAPGMLITPAVVSKVFMECIKSPDLLQRVLSLAEPWARAKEVPPMHLFGPNRMARGGRVHLTEEKLRDYTPDEEVEFGGIKETVEICAYAKYLDDGTIKHLYSALWLLPGFVKHSCVPNMSKLDVGTAAFFHASRDIKAGEELTMNWPKSRWEKLENEDWNCDCKRCKAEEKLFGSKLRPLAKAYDESVSGKNAEELAALAPVIEEAISAGTAEEKSLARTAFADAFVEYHLLLQRGGVARKGEVASAEVVIQDLRDWAPGSFRSIELIKKLGVQKTPDDFKKWIGSRAVSGEVMDAIMSVRDPHFFF